MGEKISWGKPTVWLGDKQINGVTDASSLVANDTEQSEAASEPSDYGVKSYSLTFEIKSTGKNPFAKWYRRQCEIGREQKKALLYAVTHGYKVVIPVCDKDDNIRYLVIKTPRMIRRIFNGIQWIPQLMMFDRQCCLCRIRRGRLVRKKNVWPSAKEMVEKYEKALKL